MNIEETVRLSKALLANSDPGRPYTVEVMPSPVAVPIFSTNTNQPWEVPAQENPVDPNITIVQIKSQRGVPLVIPHENSASMVRGFKGNIDLLAGAPGLLQSMVEWYEIDRDSHAAQVMIAEGGPVDEDYKLVRKRQVAEKG